MKIMSLTSHLLLVFSGLSHTAKD